ncbi:hypothetical protein JOM56_011869 [Amanita muscaria]
MYARTINMRCWQRQSPDLMSTTIRRLISLGPAVLKDGGSGPGLSLFRLGVWLC